MPSVTFILPDGSKKSYEAAEEETLLNLAHRSDPDLFERACKGSLACSKCNVIIDPKFYDLVETHYPISIFSFPYLCFFL